MAVHWPANGAMHWLQLLKVVSMMFSAAVAARLRYIYTRRHEAQLPTFWWPVLLSCDIMRRSANLQGYFASIGLFKGTHNGHWQSILAACVGHLSVCRPVFETTPEDEDEAVIQKSTSPKATPCLVPCPYLSSLSHWNQACIGKDCADRSFECAKTVTSSYCTLFRLCTESA